MSARGAIEKLTQAHEVESFDCGQADLNRFLKQQAWVSQQSSSAQTYVLADSGVVRGYYSLAAGAVTHESASVRVRKGQARHAIPVILLARLAVDRALQGQGFGAALLKDALLRTAAAAETIGARALLVHAKDEQARGFYAHFGFEPSPSDALHLMLVMKELKRRIRS
ncbi:MAG: GNAT family N-acetyltransferase [Gammaproteobacteria bacterium]|nr:GNAT family N-acetyltransferase [Gammaproteobacteria bacterium]